MKTVRLWLVIILLMNELLAVIGAAPPPALPISRPALSGDLSNGLSPDLTLAARPALQSDPICAMANEPPPPGGGSQRVYLPLILKGPGDGSATSVNEGRYAPLPMASINLADLPPDPASVAPELDLTVATDIFAATAFLYSGSDPIQFEVAPDTIEAQHVAVLRGRTLAQDDTPLPGVLISVLDHPEFGCTFSRADGAFDLVVNGGGLLTVKYELTGYAPAQRQVQVPWRDYVALPDVVLIQLDSQVTTVDLTSSDPMQVAQGSPVTDGDGTRQATLLVPQGTTAELVLPDGTTQTLTHLDIRATEYTVGENGPQAMPAELPPSSGYTYAVEYSVDEALTAGATTVRFNQPVYHYVENFLDFPVGMIVPVGYYDKQQAAWLPSDNGRVIKIVSITAGLADLDTDGDDVADNEAALGITEAERQQLTSLYTAGQSLWRVPLTHFSPIDCNWPFGPSDEDTPPDSTVPLPKTDPKPPDPDTQCRSIIECQSQTLGEGVGLSGAPFSLSYRSDRVPGRETAYTLEIPLSGPAPPPRLRQIALKIVVAGRSFYQTFSPTPNQHASFTWDGLDAYGRELQGQQLVQVHLGYTYQAVYRTPSQRSAAFAAYGDNLTGVRARQELTLWRRWQGHLGAWNAQQLGLGGWSLDAHHSYDPTGKTLYLGDGRRRSAESLNFDVITTVAGTGLPCYYATAPCGDGGPATLATLASSWGVAVRPDGTLYIAASGHFRVRRVDPAGLITTIAGTGQFCNPYTAAPCGDGGPATAAQLGYIRDLALGPDGSLYLAEGQNNRVRRVAPDGTISTVAGTGVLGFSGDGGPATQAQLNNVQDVAVGPDGSLYLADYSNHRVRRVGPDGIITTVAGGGTSINDGVPATQAQLGLVNAVAVGPDGSFFFAVSDGYSNHIRRVGPDGIVTTVVDNRRGSAGCNPITAPCGDGGPASQARIGGLYAIEVGPDGSLYLSDSTFRVRRIGPDGIITTVAGTGLLCYSGATCGEGGPSTQAPLGSVYGLAVGPDGSLYLPQTGGNERVRRVASSLPASAVGDILLTAEDGSELYVFDSTGRHLRTRNALTGAVLYQFTYDPNHLLAAITDGDGNVTTIERDAGGNPTGIVGPYGRRTGLTLDANGYLAAITNPAGETTRLVTTAAGLLTRFTTPRGYSSTFTYDSLGRLVRDDDAGGGFMTLTRSESGQSTTISLSTAMNRTTVYQLTTTSLGGQERLNTWPTGLHSTYDQGADGSRRRTSTDGSAASLLLGPDPRWGMQAPLASTASISTPGGLQASSSTARTVSLADPNDPFAIANLTETDTINGRTYSSIYNGATRTWTATSPAGRTGAVTLDALGWPTRTEAAGLAAVDLAYDSRGRLIEVAQGSGAGRRATTFSYNSQGYVAATTDPMSRTVNFSYDAAGRVTQQTLPDGRVIEYSYDANGNLASLTPPGRPAHTFTYTPVDLPAGYSPPDVVAGPDGTTYSYNLDRQPTQVTRPDGRTVAYGYDSAGRLSNLTIARGAFDYSYHPTTGNLAAISAPGGLGLAYSLDGALLTGESWSGPVSGSTGYSYDNDFRLASSSVNGGNTIAFQYDQDSLLTGAGALSLSRSGQNGLLTGSSLGSLTDAWSYNGFAEAVSYSAAYSGSPLFQTQYSRDLLGRIAVLTETIGGVTTAYGYSYDLAGRLTGVTENSAPNAAYSYDSNGNRLTFTGPGGTVTGSYDAQDRLLQYGSAVYSYTANGELQSKTAAGQTTTYQYDELGNLLAVSLPGGDQISYLVDGQGRRVGKQVNGTLTQGFLYQGQLRPAAELDGAGNIVSRFVYATRVNVPDYMVKGGVTYRFILDHLGSPRLVVDAATGAVAQRLDYDAFGRVLTDTNPGFQPFGFAGGLYDPDTGLVRFGARDYDAEAGRWTVKDPIGFGNQTSNFYNYANNDPINLVDPWGLESTECPKSWEQRVREQLDKLKEIPDWITEKSSSIDRLKNWYKKLVDMEKLADDLLDTYEAWKSPDPRDWLRSIGRNFERVPQPIPLTPTEVVNETINRGIDSADTARESLQLSPNSSNSRIRNRWYGVNSERY